VQLSVKPPPIAEMTPTLDGPLEGVNNADTALAVAFGPMVIDVGVTVPVLPAPGPDRVIVVAEVMLVRLSKLST
jgi:hypothetical protein